MMSGQEINKKTKLLLQNLLSKKSKKCMKMICRMPKNQQKVKIKAKKGKLMDTESIYFKINLFKIL